MDRSTTPMPRLERQPHTAAARPARGGRVLDFAASRHAARPSRQIPRLPGMAESEPPPTLRDRFLRAIEMERRGFMDGALATLKAIYREPGLAEDPQLAISLHYFLGSFLLLTGEAREARALVEDGILLAWEHGATDELELLDDLSRQLGG